MSVAAWLPGTLYLPGALVLPASTPPVAGGTPNNFNFELGDTGWIKGGGWVINTGLAFDGTWRGVLTGPTGPFNIINTLVAIVTPGQVINASAVFQIVNGGGGGLAQGAVCIVWRDAANVDISASVGSYVSVPQGTWLASFLNGAVAPPGAAKAVIFAVAQAAVGLSVIVDRINWDYTFAPGQADLQYKAIQAAGALSGATEPVWPTVLGGTVVDNGVTWQAVSVNRVTWQASPILRSGATEPVWPTSPGGLVADGSISWEAITRRVEDVNCPNSKIVTICQSKVYAERRDIVRYCATADPLDWTSANDAGYLPTGLQQYGSNYTSLLNIYRGSVVDMSSSTMQLWQADPDPASIALLDAMEGIGSTWNKAAVPVGTDLYYLTSQGIRSLGIAAGSTNLQAGDIGMPIDPLVQLSIRDLVAPAEPIGCYNPNRGQYMLAFGTLVYVYTATRIGQPGAWSRSIYPWPWEYTALKGSRQYIRSGDDVYYIDETKLDDDRMTSPPTPVLETVPVIAVIQWPWLDFGAPGQTKMLVGFDVVGNGVVDVQFGFDQRDQNAFTPAYRIPADTVPGGIIPMPLAAPTLSMRLTFDSSLGSWEWMASNLYFQDFRSTA